MNAFAKASLTEAKGLAILLPFISERSDGRFVVTDKGPLAPFMQTTVGDVVANTSSGNMYTIEIKIEEENRYGNLFLETWSNKNLCDKRNHSLVGSKPGWMMTHRCDFLFYYFISSDDLYIIDFFELKKWAFSHDGSGPTIDKFKEKPQAKYKQLNDTWGRCVPIDELSRALGLKMKLVHPLSLIRSRELPASYRQQSLF